MFIRHVKVWDKCNKVFDLKSMLITSSGQLEIISPEQQPPTDEEYLDLDGKFTLLPGLLDTHVHGFGGFDFSCIHDTPEALPIILDALAKSGLSFAMATFVSLPIPTLKQCLKVLDAYVNKESENPTLGRTQVVGVHLEGPFISKTCNGAHDANVLQNSISLAQFKDIIASAPHIKEWKMTLSPDLVGAMDFIKQIKSLQADGISVKIFLGHTNPKTDIIDQAVRLGVAGFTHLGNACQEPCARNPDPISEEQLSSNLVKWVMQHPENCPPGVELIVDGVHLSHSFFKLIKAKIGNQIVLVSDALGASGLKDGQYKLGSVKVVKQNNAFYIDDPQTKTHKKLAGSAASLAHCIKTFCTWAEMRSLYSAAIENPRISSLSTNAIAQLADNNNFALISNSGDLALSLCHGKLTEHMPEIMQIYKHKEETAVRRKLRC
ncbi:MAG: N-acetylglucosamine-6-phosphate deacetylase [Candidatus Berkiella sp.]